MMILLAGGDQEMKKTESAAEGVKGLLENAPGIQCAYNPRLFSGKPEESRGDVEIRVVGAPDWVEWDEFISNVEEKLGRPVDVALFTVGELRSRIKGRDSHLLRVFKESKIMLIGEHSLANQSSIHYNAQTMTNQKDCYQVLDVEKDASPQRIKEAYRRLAFQYHPDRNRENPSAVEKMKEINEAYAVLSDPGKRRDYDTFHEQYGPDGYDRFKQRYSEQDIFRGSDINQIFEEMARSFGFRNFEDVFKESYGQRYRTFQFQSHGASGRGFIFWGRGFGRNKPHGIPISSDIFPGYPSKFITTLLKKILRIKEPGRGRDLYDVIYLAPRQAVEGARGKYLHRRRSKELIVSVPPGMKEGQKIRLKRMGASGRDGGEAGDLYLKVKIKKPLLERVKRFLRIQPSP